MSQQPKDPRRKATRPTPQPTPYDRQIPPAPPTQMPCQPPPPQPEPVMIVQRQSGANPIGVFLRVITWPFRKIFGAVAWLVGVIIAAMIRSVVSFIVGLVLLALVVALITTYGVALWDSNMNTLQAFSLMLERITTFFQTLLHIQQSVPPGN